MEETIKNQDALDELNRHKTSHEKLKVKIIPCRSKGYQRTDHEEIFSIFDQVRPVVSHIEVTLPEEPPTLNNLVEGLKGPQRQLWKESLSVQYYKNKTF